LDRSFLETLESNLCLWFTLGRCSILALPVDTDEFTEIDLFNEPQAAKKHIGYLPEQLPVYRDMTVLEFLRYCAQLRGIARTAQHASIDRALQRCGLGDVSKRLIGNLSKGYQQRVGIAQAILHNPAVIILDEPTVGLDPVQIQENEQSYKHVHACGLGVLLLTQDIGDLN